jgi:DNA-binding HxlR family transcriptional regulator
MEKKDEKEFLMLLGAKGTKKLLELLDEHGTVEYKQMTGFTSVPTLNTRLRKLLALNLIEYRFEGEKERKKWYKLTDKGKRILQHLKDMIDTMG